MQISNKGLRLLQEREGLRLKAYKDTVGVWTIGYGHTSAAGGFKVNPNSVITKEQASEIFSKDLEKFEGAINKLIHVNVLQDQYDALVSLAYNIGLGAFGRSTVLKRVNLGDDRAAAAILMWNKPPEIETRRMSEYKQYIGEIK